MALETEIKFLDCGLNDVEARLHDLGARLIGAGFEENIVFDTPGGDLRASGRLLRLRRDSGVEITLKLPVAVSAPGVKTREELEIRVDDFATAERIFAGLGYVILLRYEKYRRSWSLDGCVICLDTLPFGDFVEIEGEPDRAWALASRLGLDLDKTSDRSYHDLHQAYLSSRGLPPEDSFVFTPEQKTRLPK